MKNFVVKLFLCYQHLKMDLPLLPTVETDQDNFVLIDFPDLQNDFNNMIEGEDRFRTFPILIEEMNSISVEKSIYENINSPRNKCHSRAVSSLSINYESVLKYSLLSHASKKEGTVSMYPSPTLFVLDDGSSRAATTAQK